MNTTNEMNFTSYAKDMLNGSAQFGIFAQVDKSVGAGNGTYEDALIYIHHQSEGEGRIELDEGIIGQIELALMDGGSEYARESMAYLA